MASGQAHRVHYSFAEYVSFEQTSNVKHEFLDGQIYAMAGGTPEHAALAAAVSAFLFAQLDGRRRGFSSDLRVRVRATGLATYPDVTVVCGPIERAAEDPNTAENPTLVVEVTSPSTEDYDSNEKFEHYRQIPALEAVLIVSHGQREIELWERSAQGWQRSAAKAGETLEIASLACRLSVDSVYGRAAAGA